MREEQRIEPSYSKLDQGRGSLPNNNSTTRRVASILVPAEVVVWSEIEGIYFAYFVGRDEYPSAVELLPLSAADTSSFFFNFLALAIICLSTFAHLSFFLFPPFFFSFFLFLPSSRGDALFLREGIVHFVGFFLLPFFFFYKYTLYI